VTCPSNEARLVAIGDENRHQVQWIREVSGGDGIEVIAKKAMLV